MRMRALIVTLVTGASLLGTSSSSTAGAPSAADRFRALFTQRAQSAGISVDDLFDIEATVTTYGPEGAVTTRRPFGEAIARIGDVPTPVLGEGPYGTPEYVAGNISNLFAGLWIGPSDEADEHCGYTRVRQSTIVPNTYTLAKQAADAAGLPLTNPVPVTLAPMYLTPVPATAEPVIPLTSWAMPAYVWLGPTLHITAQYDLGLHTVGTLLGSSASTATGADPYPVWAPMVTSGFVQDRSIDFLGQGLFVDASIRENLFGYTLCGTIGALVASNGVAIFDNHPVLGLDLALPDLP